MASCYTRTHGATKNPGGVVVEDHKTTYQLNPSVGNTLGGGFHCTMLDYIERIFVEGLRPGGGGDRINNFFVPFAPWDERSTTILRFKRTEEGTVIYIYLTYDTFSQFGARRSADGHILVQQTIPFAPFDAIWYKDPIDGEFYRLLVNKGQEQLVLSVRGTKKIATVERFEHLIGNIIPDYASPDSIEIRKLLAIKGEHGNYYQPRLYPGHERWNMAISLMAIVHRPDKAGCRLWPACLSETPAVLSLCVHCKGYLISHGWKKRIKVTVASIDEPERPPMMTR